MFRKENLKFGLTFSSPPLWATWDKGTKWKVATSRRNL